MSATLSQIKSLIRLVHEYRISRSEKNLVQLQRHLQILSVVSDLSIFEPTCIETLEFFRCLEQILTEADSKSTLPWKVINLLFHISHSSPVRNAMRDELLLIPVISQFLWNPNLSKDKSHKILQLLQILTYGIEIQRREAWLIKFLPHLVYIILESQVMDDSVEATVVTLANICRGNAPAVQLLCEFGERKLLVRTLIDLKSPSKKIQLLVSEILIYINLDHSKLNVEPIMNKLDLIFVVATNGFAEQDSTLLQLSKDVFEEILQRNDLQVTIKSYSKIGPTVHNLMSHITKKNDPECIGLLFELLALVIELQSDDLKEYLSPLFSKVIWWLPDVRVGCGTQRLLQALVAFADSSVVTSHLDDLLQALKECLAVKEDLNSTSQTLEWTSSLLAFVESLTARDALFNFKIAKTLAPPALTNLLNSFLETDNVGPQSGFHWSDNSSGYSSYSSTNGRKYSTDGQSSNSKKKSDVEKCAEIVVRIISIIKQLIPHNPEFKIECREMLGNPKVMKNIVCCERCADPSLVSKAMNILCEESIPNENMDALIKAQTDANMHIEEKFCLSTISNKDSFHQVAPLFGTSKEAVNDIISQLNRAVEKSEVKDIPLTAVMNFYEHKIAALTHNEKILQDTLASSDAQIRQMNLGLLQSRAETTRLRGLLHMWEERIQLSQKQKQDIGTRVTELQEKSRIQRDELVKKATNLERQLAKVNGELSNARLSIESKEEDNRRLQRSLTEASREAKSFQKIIKQEQEEKTKLTEIINKMEEDKKRNKRSFEDLEKENSRLEKMHAGLKKENTELEMLIKSHEETLTEKEAQVEEMKVEIVSLKKIRDMIHNISAGKLQ